MGLIFFYVSLRKAIRSPHHSSTGWNSLCKNAEDVKLFQYRFIIICAEGERGEVPIRGPEGKRWTMCEFTEENRKSDGPN